MAIKKRFTIIPAVYLVLVKNDEVLLSRRFNTGYQDGNYSMIAGHLDGDEPLEVAIAREALEEAGITIDPTTLQLVHTMHTRSEDGSLDDERVDFYFKTDVFTGQPTIKEVDKCDDLRWFNLQELPDNIIPRVRQALEHIVRDSKYSSLGW